MPARSKTLRPQPTVARLGSLLSQLSLGACLLLSAGHALAGITPIGVHSSESTRGDTRSDPRATLWQYDMALLRSETGTQVALPTDSRRSADHLLLNGGSFTLFGFAGYVDQSCLAPTGWSCVASQLGLSEAEALPDGSAERLALSDVVNLTWTYLGAKLGGTVQGLALGIFSAESMADGGGMLAWSASGLPAAAGRGGNTSPWLQTGGIAGPGQLALAVPEPSSLALSALAVVMALGMGLGLPARKRRNETNAAG